MLRASFFIVTLNKQKEGESNTRPPLPYGQHLLLLIFLSLTARGAIKGTAGAAAATAALPLLAGAEMGKQDHADDCGDHDQHNGGSKPFRHICLLSRQRISSRDACLKRFFFCPLIGAEDHITKGGERSEGEDHTDQQAQHADNGNGIAAVVIQIKSHSADFYFSRMEDGFPDHSDKTEDETDNGRCFLQHPVSGISGLFA